MLSGLVAAAAFVLMTFWDVYDSSMQTFGLARIYGSKAGESPHERRWADLTVNLLLYAGPVFGGAMLVNHSCALCKSGNFEPRSVKDLSPIENEFVLPAFRKLREGTGHPAVLVMPGKSNALHQPLKWQLRDRLRPE